MKKLMLASLLILCMVGAAQADLFNFNTLSDGANSAAISTYMTGIRPSGVTVTDAEVETTGWTGNATPFILTIASSDFEIRFTTPIDWLKGVGGTGQTVGRVLLASPSDDFSLKAYDSTYGGNEENPADSALVYSQSWNGGVGNVLIPDITFSRPVTLLVFSDNGVRDVGIDNLEVGQRQVDPVVPVPGAVLLGLLGLCAAGLKLRKFA